MSVQFLCAGVYLKPVLVQCIHAAVKSDRSPYCKKKSESFVKRRDKQRAIIVIVHMILNVIYQMLPTDILCKYCMVLWLLSLVSLQYR